MKFKFWSIILKGFSLRTPINSEHSFKIVKYVRKALPRDRIHFRWDNKVCQLKRIQLENVVKSSRSNSNSISSLLSKVLSGISLIYKKLFLFIIYPALWAREQSLICLSLRFQEIYPYLSKHMFIISEEVVLVKGLGLLIMYSHSKVDYQVHVREEFSMPDIGKEGWKPWHILSLKNILELFMQTKATSQWCWMIPNTRIS